MENNEYDPLLNAKEHRNIDDFTLIMAEDAAWFNEDGFLSLNEYEVQWWIELEDAAIIVLEMLKKLWVSEDVISHLNCSDEIREIWKTDLKQGEKIYVHKIHDENYEIKVWEHVLSMDLS